MAAVSILDSLEHLILVRGPLRAVIELKAREVLRDFLKFTRAWQVEYNESVLALVPDYDIQLPFADAYPVSIESLSIDGTPASFRETAWLDAMIAGWRARSADDFRYYTQLQPGQFSFPGVPTRNGTIGGLYYRVSFMPRVAATQFDDSTYNEFAEELAAGTRWKLLSMAGEPWHNEKGAAEAHSVYNGARGRARIRVGKSFGNAAQQWVGPRFA